MAHSSPPPKEPRSNYWQQSFWRAPGSSQCSRAEPCQAAESTSLALEPVSPSQCLLIPSMILCFVGCCNLWSSGVATVLWPVAQGAGQVIWQSPVRTGTCRQAVSSITQSLGRRKNVVMHSTPNKSFHSVLCDSWHAFSPF